nr:uncharacterized protein c14c4.01c [Quercus suber]
MSGGLQDAAIQAAETIQTAHINRAPTKDDIAPSTAADAKQNVIFESSADLEDDSEADEDEVPISLLRPPPQRPQMPPLPDLRFEQSYLKSIEKAKGWSGVVFITIKDQVMMPLVQGLAWTLIVAGWKHWNRDTQLVGQTMGAKIRRWWWGVNDWHIPARAPDRAFLWWPVQRLSYELHDPALSSGVSINRGTKLARQLTTLRYEARIGNAVITSWPKIQGHLRSLQSHLITPLPHSGSGLYAKQANRCSSHALESGSDENTIGMHCKPHCRQDPDRYVVGHSYHMCLVTRRQLELSRNTMLRHSRQRKYWLVSAQSLNCVQESARAEEL